MKSCRACVGFALLPSLVSGIAFADNAGDHPTSELVRQARQATEQFQDVQLAVAAGYEPGPCVSGPNSGAMGIHYINPAFLDDAEPVLA